MQQDGQGTNAAFAPTHWSIVLHAAERNTPGASDALETLCRTYWYPLYAFLRRSGHKPHEAQDLVQGFFEHLLAAESRLRSANPVKGRFRNFLLACLKHYVLNEHAKTQAACRRPPGGMISIDEVLAEERYDLEPADISDPARIYERRWAFTVVEQTVVALKEIWHAKGKGQLFAALIPFITGDDERGDYAGIASRLKTSEGALRATVTRLRKEFRRRLLKQIELTVDSPAEVEAELRELLALFSS